MSHHTSTGSRGKRSAEQASGWEPQDIPELEARDINVHTWGGSLCGWMEKTFRARTPHEETCLRTFKRHLCRWIAFHSAGQCERVVPYERLYGPKHSAMCWNLARMSFLANEGEGGARIMLRMHCILIVGTNPALGADLQQALDDTRAILRVAKLPQSGARHKSIKTSR